MPRRGRLLAFVVLAVLVLGCRSMGADGPVPASHLALFEGAEGRDEVSARLAAPWIRCVDVPTVGPACEWHLGSHAAHHRELAEEIGSSDRVGVICAFPSEGPRGDDDCTLHQRRSNRIQVAPPTRVRPGESRSRMVAEAHRRERARIEAARDLLAMSRMLGQLPEDCVKEAGESVCRWILSDQTFGHGSVALVHQLGSTRKVRWICRFPNDGSPRGTDSCRGEIDELNLL